MKSGFVIIGCGLALAGLIAWLCRPKPHNQVASHNLFPELIGHPVFDTNEQIGEFRAFMPSGNDAHVLILDTERGKKHLRFHSRTTDIQEVVSFYRFSDRAITVYVAKRLY